MNAAGEFLYLGIDAGGTGCRARLADSEGRVLGEGTGGPGTARLGVEHAFEAMMAATRKAWGAADLGPFDFARLHVGAGFAGYFRAGIADEFAVRPHPFASLTVTDDGTIACLGAHSGGDGGVVIAGTGSIGFGLVAGHHLRFGGYGFPASDEGSGAWLGLGAMETAFRAADGRVPSGSLARAVLARFEGNVPAMILWCDAASAADYAALAPLVAANARQDAFAAGLMLGAGEALADLGQALLDAGCERLCLQGGLAETIRPFMPPKFQGHLGVPHGDALDGALHLAGLSQIG